MLIQLIVFAVIALDSYRDTIANSITIAQNIAALIERDIGRNFEIYNLSLNGIARNVSDPEVMGLPPRLRQIAIFDAASTAPGIGAMVVLDKDGNIFLDSLQSPARSGNFSDREYFKFQRDTPRPDGFYLSRPFQLRLQENAWGISISRRLNAPDGSFAGIVLATLKLDFIRDRMDVSALGPRGTVSLFREDGIVLIQTIAGNPNVGADWSRVEVIKRLAVQRTGSYLGSGTIDPVIRLYAYRGAAGLPLVVNAGIARDDVLAPWWFKVGLIASVFVAMAASVIFLVAMFIRELRRRIAAEQAQGALARRDGLSQISNRRGFDEALTKGWRRAARNREPLSLIMIDADHFKKFNDQYGHPEGDKLLVALAGAISGAAGRPDDVAARYGGEEFAVLLPNTGAAGAMRVAESIRKQVEDMAVFHESTSHGVVTVSLGVATIVPDNGGSPQALVADADRALYEAKSGGRNRVCLSRAASNSGASLSS